MPKKDESHEQATMLVLLFARQEVPNPDLKKKYGITFPATSRDKLKNAGLIESRKDGARWVHKITDEGIAWCATELAKVETPQRSGPLAKMVFELTRNLPLYLRWQDIDFAEVLGQGSLEGLIRNAYRDLSVKRQDWVQLARLRPEIDDIGRDEVDGVLLRMIKTGRVHLAPDSNRKALTEEDHRAAVRIGGEENHLVAIEES
jgi:hypothetical protein